MLGVVEDTDTAASGDCLGKYLHVRVMMNIDQPQRAVNFVLGKVRIRLLFFWLMKDYLNFTITVG